MTGKKATRILILCMLPFILLSIGCTRIPVIGKIAKVMPGPAATLSRGQHQTPIIPPPGFIYSSYSAPLDLNYSETGTGELLKVSHKKTQYINIL